MKLLKNFKGILYKADFFYTTQLLRYNNQPQYKTLCGGCLSIIIITILIVTFFNKCMNTVDKVIINSISDNTNAADPTPFTISTFDKDKFMFGVQIWHHDLNTGLRYFDIVMTSVQFDTGQKRPTSMQYPLEPCQTSHWQGFPDVQKQYARLKMNYWLCLPKNSTYNIQGKYASVFSQTLQVAVKKCTNASDPSRPCADQATIDQYFLDAGPFFFTIYFINPLINPTSQQFLTFYLQDNNYIIFTDKLGAEGVLFLQEYNINTDESIIPLTSTHQKKGGIVTQFALKNPYQVTQNNDVYCSFSFFKSGISRNYNRSFQKIDEVLSYIGGLFGTIAILLFIVNVYNTNSFQIAIGAYLFQNKDANESSNLKNYNFLSFLAHLLYMAFDLINCTPDWQVVKKYHKCRQQMKKQLDIRYLIKRIFFLQRTIRLIFQDYQLKGLHLLENLTLEQAKKGRRDFKLKANILKQWQQNRKTSLVKQWQQSRHPETRNIITNPNFQQQSAINLQSKFNSSLNYDILAQNQNVYNQNSINENIIAKQFILEQNQNTFQLNNIQEFLQEDQSSSSQDEEYYDHSISEEITKIKYQSEKGNVLSQKIWENIDESIKKQLSYFNIKQEKRRTLRMQTIAPAAKNVTKKRTAFLSSKVTNQYEQDKNNQKSKKLKDKKRQYNDSKLIIQDKKINAQNLQEESSPNNMSFGQN